MLRRNLYFASKSVKSEAIKVDLDPELMPRANYQQPTRTCNEVKVGFENQLVEPSSRTEVAENTFFLPNKKYGTILSPHLR